jgi:hypothetical protein
MLGAGGYVSSGTITEPYAAKKVSGAAGDRILEKVKRLGMTPRQQALNALWAWYRTQHYDARRCDWDGTERVQGIDHEAIATAGFIPPGFYDAGQTFPIKFRRPTAPYALIKVIVDRFTGLLFSERRHPHLRVDGDHKTEDYVQALAEAARLWPAMIQARTYGGATGSVAIGFKFIEGKPIVEVHDPRWMFPDFKDREQLVLKSVEKRYQYPVEIQNEVTGDWEEVPHWYRRVINEKSDVLYEPVPVPKDGSEPEWKEQQHVEHRFGFCPVVWVQNLPVQDDVDGDPDCHGIYDLAEAIDALISQGNRGTTANCDPTLVIITEAKLADVRKGSDNAIKLPPNSSAQYLEISGQGPKSALDTAGQLRTYALEVAQCVLDHPDVANRTATEVERVFSSMLSKADILREQYGQKGVLPLVEMMIKSIRMLGKSKAVSVVRQSEEGEQTVPEIQSQFVKLPDRVIPGVDGEPAKREKRELGPPGSVVVIQWGAYFDSSTTDIAASSDAATKAQQGGLIDQEHAARFVAPYFHVEDVPEMLAKVKREKEEAQAAMDQQLMGGMGQNQGWSENE